jgi:hypothetical protein
MRRSEARKVVRMPTFMDIFGRWDAAELNQIEAAELLGVGERTFRRWCRRYEEEGEAVCSTAGLVRRRAKGCRWTGARRSSFCIGRDIRASPRGISTNTRCAIIGSPGATVGRKFSCKAGTCCRKRSVAARTGASGRVVRCPA